MDIVKELKKIRNRLISYNSKKAFEISAVEGESRKLPSIKFIDPSVPQNRVKIITDPKEIFRTVKDSIKTVEETNWAQVYWSIYTLLPFTRDERAIICRALLERFDELGIRPQQLWLDMLKKPEVYDEWKDELSDSKIIGKPLKVSGAPEVIEAVKVLPEERM